MQLAPNQQIQKHKPCFLFQKNNCDRGDSCRYSHDLDRFGRPNQPAPPPRWDPKEKKSAERTSRSRSVGRKGKEESKRVEEGKNSSRSRSPGASESKKRKSTSKSKDRSKSKEKNKSERNASASPSRVKAHRSRSRSHSRTNSKREKERPTSQSLRGRDGPQEGDRGGFDSGGGGGRGRDERGGRGPSPPWGSDQFGG